MSRRLDGDWKPSADMGACCSGAPLELLLRCTNVPSSSLDTGSASEGASPSSCRMPLRSCTVPFGPVNDMATAAPATAVSLLDVRTAAAWQLTVWGCALRCESRQISQ